jgi:hypothetical protein
MRILNAHSIQVAPGEKRMVPFSVEALTSRTSSMQSVSFLVTDGGSGSTIESEVMFYSGNSMQM